MISLQYASLHTHCLGAPPYVVGNTTSPLAPTPSPSFLLSYSFQLTISPPAGMGEWGARYTTHSYGGVYGTHSPILRGSACCQCACTVWVHVSVGPPWVSSSQYMAWGGRFTSTLEHSVVPCPSQGEHLKYVNIPTQCGSAHTLQRVREVVCPHSGGSAPHPPWVRGHLCVCGVWSVHVSVLCPIGPLAGEVSLVIFPNHLPPHQRFPEVGLIRGQQAINKN